MRNLSPADIAALRSEEPRPRLNEAPNGLIVAIPLYRSPELLPDLESALIAMAGELKGLNGSILFLNDSPDDEELATVLSETVARMRSHMPVELVANASNLGFLHTANRALEHALASDRDVILLNSDALPRPGAFAEMLAVAYLDPMISVVSPRSDNATICNSPIPGFLRSGSRDEAFAAHSQIVRHLPRMTYVPTAVGFCLLVRRLMLAEFGLFDAAYGAGYNEENDFIRRCNQRGYRAVLANNAYVHHIGEVSFAKTDHARDRRNRVNHALLLGRYPEYDRVIQRHFDSPDHHAERVLAGLIPFQGRMRLVFDCSVLEAFFNGTFEHVRALLSAFARSYGDRYDIRILCDRRAFDFHDLGAIPSIRHCTAEDLEVEPAAIAFRMSQPMPQSAASLARMAAITGALMLDTIAMDCQQLDEADLASLWQHAAADLDMVGFNSGFSRDQFERRFGASEHRVRFVSLCSTAPADYVAPDRPHRGGGGILLIGNHFPHKHMREMCRGLHAAGCALPIVTFGLDLDEPGVTKGYTAGLIPSAVVERLYDEADLVLFPSHYEGFGLPIMHALARGVAVVARDIPSAREIRAATPFGANLHLAGSTADMIALALDPPRWRSKAGPGQGRSWSDAARALDEAFQQALERFDFAACRKQHLRSAALMRGEEASMLRERVHDLEYALRAARPDSGAPPQALGAASGRYRLYLRRARQVAASPRGRVAALSDRVLLGAAPVRALSGSPAACHRRLRLRLDAQDDVHTFRDGLLRWSNALAPGGLLAVDLLRSACSYGGHRQEVVVDSVFHLADCSLERLDMDQGSIRATGRRLPPPQALPEELGSEDYVRALYRQLYGRAPNADERARCERMLSQGVSRADLMTTIARSDERWEATLRARA